MNSPLISIVTAVYNHEKYLDDYFHSIMRQSYKNIELILINDASTDQSLVIIETWLPKLEERFKKMTFISRKENKGLVFNCNEGIEIAEGKYIALFASDDIMMVTNLEEKVNYLEQNLNKAMVCSDVYYGKNFHAKKHSITNPKLFNKTIFQRLIDQGNFIFAPSVVVRKNVLLEVGKYNNKYPMEDYPMWLEISRNYEIGYISKPLIFYRLSENSLSRDVEKFRIMVESHMEILIDMEKKYKCDISKGINSLYTMAAVFFYSNEVKYYQEYRKKINKTNMKIIVIDMLIQLKITAKHLRWVKNRMKI